MKVYRISFDILQTSLETYSMLLRGEVDNLRIEEVSPARKRYLRPRRAPLRDLALKFVREHGRDAEFSVHEMGALFVESGYSAGSASPLCSELAEKNMLARVGPSRYKILRV